MKTNRLFFLIPISFLLACGSTEYSDIPSTPVNLTLYLSDKDKELNSVTAHKIYTKKNINTSQQEYAGFGGVVVYHTTQINVYNAYDISCPYETKQDVVINIEQFSTTATCPNCGSVFNLENGAPISGPSAENPGRKRLRIYSTILSGDKIYVRN